MTQIHSRHASRRVCKAGWTDDLAYDKSCSVDFGRHSDFEHLKAQTQLLFPCSKGLSPKPLFLSYHHHIDLSLDLLQLYPPLPVTSSWTATSSHSIFPFRATMPLPGNGVFSLQGHSKPGDTQCSKPKQAMIVRMSSETLDALDGQAKMQFEFGDSPVLLSLVTPLLLLIAR